MSSSSYAGEHGLEHPLVSPLHADLSGLPLLIHVGTAEVLLDDAVRLAERARAPGSTCTSRRGTTSSTCSRPSPVVPEAVELEGIGAFTGNVWARRSPHSHDLAAQTPSEGVLHHLAPAVEDGGHVKTRRARPSEAAR